MSDERARQLAALRPGEHLGLVYEAPAEGRAALVTFFEQGRRRGERCVYVGPRGIAQQVWRRIAEEARWTPPPRTPSPAGASRRP